MSNEAKARRQKLIAWAMHNRGLYSIVPHRPPEDATEDELNEFIDWLEELIDLRRDEVRDIFKS